MATPEGNRPPQALEAVVSRAASDGEFRHHLLTDPRRAIQEQFGVIIPVDFRIKFIERGADVDALIVLPDFKPQRGQLSDDDLEAVSGGTTPDFDAADWADPIL